MSRSRATCVAAPATVARSSLVLASDRHLRALLFLCHWGDSLPLVLAFRSRCVYRGAGVRLCGTRNGVAGLLRRAPALTPLSSWGAGNYNTSQKGNTSSIQRVASSDYLISTCRGEVNYQQGAVGKRTD